jgi:uncharacterized membrane protein
MDSIIIIKIFALIFSTLIYVFGGLFITFILDKYVFKYVYDETDNDINKKTTFRHFAETSYILAVIAIFGYIGRNVFQNIPFPLDSINGFEYMRVKEVSSGLYISYIILIFSVVLNRKISILRNRFASL